MYLALTSMSQDPVVTRPILEKIAEALEYQAHAHYAPLWQSEGCGVRVFSSPEAIPEDDGSSPLVVFDDPDQAGVLGWHTVSPTGRPYGRAFWKVIRDHGGSLYTGPLSLSVTLSHEVLEMIGNPYVNFWADMPSGIQEAIELCDRVEMDSYLIGGDVAVSNFLGPRAFRNGAGPYDYMRLLGEPWDIRPGGYAIRKASDGTVFDVWGSGYPSWRKDLKGVLGSRTQRRHAGLVSA